MSETEQFLRMPASVLRKQTPSGRIDERLVATLDGRDDALWSEIDALGIRVTWESRLGGFEIDALGLPKRLRDRLRGVTDGVHTWPGHPDEPEVFRARASVIFVPHDELVALHRSVSELAADGFSRVPEYEDDSDIAADLAGWLAPVADDEIEVWFFANEDMPYVPPA